MDIKKHKIHLHICVKNVPKKVAKLCRNRAQKSFDLKTSVVYAEAMVVEVLLNCFETSSMDDRVALTVAERRFD